MLRFWSNQMKTLMKSFLFVCLICLFSIWLREKKIYSVVFHLIAMKIHSSYHCFIAMNH